MDTGREREEGRDGGAEGERESKERWIDDQVAEGVCVCVCVCCLYIHKEVREMHAEVHTTNCEKSETIRKREQTGGLKRDCTA